MSSQVSRLKCNPLWNIVRTSNGKQKHLAVNHWQRCRYSECNQWHWLKQPSPCQCLLYNVIYFISRALQCQTRAEMEHKWNVLCATSTRNMQEWTWCLTLQYEQQACPKFYTATSIDHHRLTWQYEDNHVRTQQTTSNANVRTLVMYNQRDWSINHNTPLTK